MKKEIIINAAANETRIAITEDGRLAEIFVETANREKMVGDIYLGRVAKVMTGINAAFIDLGLNQDGFLHFSDIGKRFEEFNATIGDDEDDDDEDAEGGSGTGVPERTADQPRQRGPRSPSRGDRRSPDPGSGQAQRAVNLTKGQEIIVQITKEPVGKKGVRVTSEISLAGRFLVLLPFDGKVGISRKIQNFREKRRLRRIVQSILPSGFGVILRTVADGKDEQTLRKDLESLIETWREIEKGAKTDDAPALLYKDMATTSSVIRDLFSNDVDRVVVDSKKLYREIRAYIKFTSPPLLDKIELHRDRAPIFDTFGVEKEIATTLSRKVWLKSGGYIIIEPTEAMMVIDVNSGRYAPKKDQEQNSLRTNLEASREITRQLRLRDIGGIIVCDFIDLEEEKNKRKVFEELRKEFRRDRSKVTILPMTEFGLVQITRQRIRQNILHSFTEPCPACGGAGLVQSKTTTFNQLERWIRRFRSESNERRLIVRVHPELGLLLRAGVVSRLRKMMMTNRVWIALETDPSIPLGEFRCLSPKQDNKDITDQYN